RRPEYRGVRGGHHLQVAGGTPAADVVHEAREILTWQADVLASDVSQTHVGDGGVDVAGVVRGCIVSRQHEDELAHGYLLSIKMSDNLVMLLDRRLIPLGRVPCAQRSGTA